MTSAAACRARDASYGKGRGIPRARRHDGVVPAAAGLGLRPRPVNGLEPISRPALRTRNTLKNRLKPVLVEAAAAGPLKRGRLGLQQGPQGHAGEVIGGRS